MSSKILVFTAKWCVPCTTQKPIIHRVAKEYDDVCLEIHDIDESVGMRTAADYNIRSVPTFVVIDKDGIEVERTFGAQTEAQIDSIFNHLSNEEQK